MLLQIDQDRLCGEFRRPLVLLNAQTLRAMRGYLAPTHQMVRYLNRQWKKVALAQSTGLLLFKTRYRS